MQTDFFSPLGKVAALTWYNGGGGSPAENANSLAICYESGKCQIMKHHMDDGKISKQTRWLVNGIST